MAKALTASAFAMLARALRASARIAALLCVARYQGVAAVADFSYSFVVASLVGIVLDAGLSEYASREVAAQSEGSGQLAWRVAWFRLLTLPIGAAAAFGVAITTGAEQTTATLGGVLFALAASIADSLAALHRGESRHDRESVESAMPIAAVGIAFGVVSVSAVATDAFAWLAGAVACALVILRAVAMLLRRRGLGPAAKMSTWLYDGRWFLARALVTYALFDSQTVLLQQLSERSEVAIYSIAVRPLGLMTQALAVLTFVFMPELSRLYGTDRPQFGVKAARLNVLYLSAIPAAFAACVVGGHLLLAAAGNEYADGMRILAVSAIGVLVYVAPLTLGPVIAARRERGAFVAALLGLLVLVLASVLLVPRYGAMGVSGAALIAFSLTKIAHAALYRDLGLALVERMHVPAYGFVALFFVSIGLAPAGFRLIPILVGAVVSAIITVRMVARARIA